MPLTSLTYTVNTIWQLSKTNSGGYNPTTQGPDSLTYNLNNLSATFNQVVAETYTISASAHQEIDLTALLNLVDEAVDFTQVLTILVLPTGSQCTVSPGGTNPLQWFFGGTTQSVIVPAGGMLAFSGPPAGPGATVDSTDKTLRFTNSGGTTLSVDVVILGAA